MVNIRPLRRLLALGLLALAVTALAGPPLRVFAVRQGQPKGEAASQGGPNRAGLVIRYADGDVQTSCVSFEVPDISGEEVLRLAGVELGLAMDGRVCTIDRVGCLPNDCWCECTDLDNCTYWAYYHLDGNTWTYSEQGATFARVGNGAVEGWSWGKGDFATGGVQPPVYSFDEVCAATPTATPTLIPTATAKPVAMPRISAFAAIPATIAAGACATLQWTVLDADDVQLDGVAVNKQGQQQVCPPASRSYSLTARSTAGSDTRQTAVQVQSAKPVQPTTGPATNRVPQQAGTVTETSVEAPAAVQPEAVEATPVVLVATRAPFRFALPPTSTPRPRSVLGADGRPTPTPMLLARTDTETGSQSPPQALRRSRDEGALVSANRSFQASLLPGYAAFLLMAAALLGMGAWITRRKLRAGRPSLDSKARSED